MLRFLKEKSCQRCLIGFKRLIYYIKPRETKKFPCGKLFCGTYEFVFQILRSYNVRMYNLQNKCYILYVVDPGRFELPISRMQTGCSTTELQALFATLKVNWFTLRSVSNEVWARKELNLLPLLYQRSVLTDELRAQNK